MIIKLSPVRSDAALVLLKNGDTLTVNGEDFNFSQLSEGATLPYGSVFCPAVIQTVDRENGELILSILMPHKAYASEASRFPSPLTNVPDGRVVLPTDYDIEPVVIEFEEDAGNV